MGGGNRSFYCEGRRLDRQQASLNRVNKGNAQMQLRFGVEKRFFLQESSTWHKSMTERDEYPRNEMRQAFRQKYTSNDLMREMCGHLEGNWCMLLLSPALE